MPGLPATSLAPPVPSRAGRIGLAALAVGADLAWRAALLLPWAFGLVLGALWWQQTWVWWLLAGGLGLLAWALWPAPAAGDGERLTAAEAPGLFAELDRLRATLALPKLDAVRLGDTLNAGVRETGPIWWPWAQRRTLEVGLPLLGLLDEARARAVLAHELAHLSRRHGRLGQWLYRARLAWLALAEPPPPQASAYERGVHQVAAWFAPWFARRALAHARACEREADAGAAASASAAALVDALQWLDVGQRRLHGWLAGPWQALKARQPSPPADFWARALAALRAGPVTAGEQAAAWADAAPAPDDTHPPLAARAAALGVRPDELDPAGPTVAACAGAAWLADWPAALARAGARRQRAEAPMWWAAHAWLRCCAARAEAAEGTPALARAQALAALGREGEALALLATTLARMPAVGDHPGTEATLVVDPADPANPVDHADRVDRAANHAADHAADHVGPARLAHLAQAADPADAADRDHPDHPDRPALALALGEAWLRTGPARRDEALALLESAVQADPGLARAARTAALQATGLDTATRARLAALRDRAAARRAQAAAAADERLTQARLAGPGLPADALAALDALCTALAPVRAAWLGRAEVASGDGRPYTAHVLLLQAGLEALADAGLDEDALAQPFAWLLGQARPSPADLVLVRVCFTTEQALPAALAGTPARAWRRPLPAQAPAAGAPGPAGAKP